MSRHNGREHLYQLVILDYSKKNNNHHYLVDGCPPVIDVKDGRIKVVDTLSSQPPHRTIISRRKTAKAAMRWGSRYGTVISCEKVDTTSYLKNIEYLNLKQKPRIIKLDKEEFIVTKRLELEHSLDTGVKKVFEIDIDS